MSDGDAYYWAGGDKVPLAADSRVAVDETRARAQDLWDGELADATASDGQAVRDGLVMLPADAVSAPLRERLDRAGALVPVYRSEDSIVMVLPEVRMETGSAAGTSDVRSAIGRIDSAASVQEPTPGRLIVTPSSGRGADALNIANRITEELRPDVAQARFLRITPQ
jgi:hypothetical protein